MYQILLEPAKLGYFATLSTALQYIPNGTPLLVAAKLEWTFNPD
ncbi:hypothetical protein ACEYW6_20360 [Nostoc sp. UIC 10607]